MTLLDVDALQNKHSDVAPNIAAILTIDDEFNVTEYVRQKRTRTSQYNIAYARVITLLLSCTDRSRHRGPV